uniref:Uncharacterized protein n=1 Tax=Aegilops tauschii TaxID=37682 RepID=M8CM81_AEGTA
MGEADESTGGGDPQKLKRIAAGAYDYENDARTLIWWLSQCLPQVRLNPTDQQQVLHLHHPVRIPELVTQDLVRDQLVHLNQHQQKGQETLYGSMDEPYISLSMLGYG